MGITGKGFGRIEEKAGRRQRLLGIAGEKGFVFSLDLLVASLAMVLMLSLMLLHWNAAKDRELESLEKLGLERRAVFALDSLVKNRDEEKPLLGAAVYDLGKRRVLQNEMDAMLLFLAGMEEGRIELGEGQECLSLDRLVLIEGRLEKLELLFCE